MKPFEDKNGVTGEDEKQDPERTSVVIQIMLSCSRLVAVKMHRDGEIPELWEVNDRICEMHKK